MITDGENNCNSLTDFAKAARDVYASTSNLRQAELFLVVFTSDASAINANYVAQAGSGAVSPSGWNDSTASRDPHLPQRSQLPQRDPRVQHRRPQGRPAERLLVDRQQRRVRVGAGHGGRPRLRVRRRRRDAVHGERPRPAVRHVARRRPPVELRRCRASGDCCASTARTPPAPASWPGRPARSSMRAFPERWGPSTAPASPRAASRPARASTPLPSCTAARSPARSTPPRRRPRSAVASSPRRGTA